MASFKQSDLPIVGGPAERAIRSLKAYGDTNFALATDVATLEADLATLDTAVTDLSDSGTYTPTLNGMAIGTGGSATNTARYHWSNGLLVVQGTIVFGSSGATFPGGNINAVLPPGYSALQQYNVNDQVVGQCVMRDNGTNGFPGICILYATNSVRFLTQTASGTYLTQTATSTTVPFTWVAGDSITYQYTVITA